jgi:thiol-disulfide isomerase/thioredoxin
MNRLITLFLVLSTASAFSPAFTRISAPRSCGALQMRVVDIGSEAAFDKSVTSAGDALVVVDYSTTWCGPCKVISPKFDEFSEKYPSAIFLKVRNIGMNLKHEHPVQYSQYQVNFVVICWTSDV